MNSGHFLDLITFNDGTTMQLQKDDIIVFVGGNNVGKSNALRNLFNKVAAKSYKIIHEVITSASLKNYGEFNEARAILFESGLVVNGLSDNTIKVDGMIMNPDHLQKEWDVYNKHASFARLFTSFLPTESRISDSNPIDSIDFTSQKPVRAIHKLFADSKLEEELSILFRDAFSTDLIVNRHSGKKITLHIGEKPIREKTDEYLTSYYSKVGALPGSTDQGDGIRSFISLAQELVVSPATLLLIDEPEAFLHPPQAKLLANYISRKHLKKQIFVATHSTDFIKGLLEGKNKRIKIIRLTREDNINIPCLLSNDDIQLLWNDPILKYSSILDGLFHERVLVCEGDGDCRFFTAMLENIFEDTTKKFAAFDSLFVAAHGKYKMPGIIKALRKISVPTFTICDFDIFNNISPLRELVESHGGEWKDVEKNWKIFKTTIDSLKSQLDKNETREEILNILNSSNSNYVTELETDKIKKILKNSSAWSFAKNMGLSFIPNGESHNACVSVIKYLNDIGIFPLLTGELESFDRSVGNGNKAKWLEEVLKKDISSNFKDAKDFLTMIFGTIQGAKYMGK